MPFDPTKPVNNALNSSAEMRGQLTGLNLAKTPAATDAILPVLQDLKKLKDLGLKETAVTEEALKAFKKKRPDIRVVIK